MQLPRSKIAVLALLLFASCGASTMSQIIYTNPPDASVYMNGVQVQKGMNLSHEFDFGRVDRILVQATSPGFEPAEQYFYAKDLERLTRDNTKLRIELRQR